MATVLGETYIARYRKRFFWKKIEIKAHNLDKSLDRMDFFTPDGGVLSITHWSKYDMKLGADWVYFNEKQKQKESEQQPVNFDAALR